MRHDAIRTGVIVVHSSSGGVELDAHETAERSLVGKVPGVDHLDGRVRAVGEVKLGAMRIDEADVERTQRVAWNLDRFEALGLRIGWCAWAHTVAERGAGCRERHGAQQRRSV